MDILKERSFRLWLTASLFIFIVFIPPAYGGNEPDKKAPGPEAAGEVYQWKSEDNLIYHYRVPENYDPEKGACLTLILHGSNLGCGWGFANHRPETLRPDDIVVCPNGTTSNGQGGFNFLGKMEDLKRLHDPHEELKKIFKVNATFLFGHSQGSFFSLAYAGEFPDDVQGVVGHASGVWRGTKMGKRGHHQAIVLMHGTQDPVVPYFQSEGGYEAFIKAKYPVVRLRSLEGWNHWPAEHNGPVPHTSQQLAWCEGMTTTDLERMETCFDSIASCKKRERTDHAAVYTLARHILDVKEAPEGLKARAQKAMEDVNGLALKHADALKDVDPSKYDGKSWIGHMPMFLRAFMDVPAREDFYSRHRKLLNKHEKEGAKHYKKHWTAMQQGKFSKAFEEGVNAVKKGYLWQRSTDKIFLDNLERWEAESKKHKISKKALKDYKTFVSPIREALKTGADEFDAINR